MFGKMMIAAACFAATAATAVPTAKWTITDLGVGPNPTFGSRASIVQFRVSRFIMRLNQTFELKVKSI